MKKLLLPLVLFLFTINGFAQITKIERDEVIKETKVAPMGKFWASMTLYEDRAEFMVRDAKFQYLDKYVHFQLDIETMNQLYDLLTNGEAKVDDEFHVNTLGKETLYIYFKKSFGKVFPTIFIYEGKYDQSASYMSYLNNKQYAKLFGKK